MVGSAAGAIADDVPVGEWMHVGKNLGHFGDFLGLAKSASELGEAAGSGDVDGSARAALDIAWFAGGKFIPHVAAAKGAWDVGWYIGDRIYDVGEVIGVNDWFQDSIINDAIQREYGGEIPADFDKRYDGVDGFGRYVGDSVISMTGKLKFW